MIAFSLVDGIVPVDGDAVEHVFPTAYYWGGDFLKAFLMATLPASSAAWIQRGTSIASFNVNGIRSHLDRIKLLMNNCKVHSLASNEIKSDPGYSSELTAITGYQEER